MDYAVRLHRSLGGYYAIWMVVDHLISGLFLAYPHHMVEE